MAGDRGVLSTALTNARTEGTNRLIKQVKRAACGFRNRDNYRRRVRLHCTRHTADCQRETRRCPQSRRADNSAIMFGR